MKLAEKIISQLVRKKSDQPDAFEKRLTNLGKEAQRRGRTVLPTLFVRHANA